MIKIWARSQIPGCSTWKKKPWNINLPSSTAPGSGTEALTQFPTTQWLWCKPSSICFQQNHLSQIYFNSPTICDIESTALMATFVGSNNVAMISPDLIHATGCGNPQYEKLIVIQQGFPRTHNLTAPKVCEYWELRHYLSTDNGLVLLDQRIVISKMQWRKVLHCLHSALHEVVGMKACANELVYSPGMDASICSIWANCMICSSIAPSQPW